MKKVTYELFIVSLMVLNLFTATNHNRNTPLEYSDALSEVAAIRAEEAAEHWSHKRPDGKGFQTALWDNGIDFVYAGECLAYGYKTAEEVIDAWMDSPSHKRVLLIDDFEYIGVGCYESDDGTPYYCVLMIDVLDEFA